MGKTQSVPLRSQIADKDKWQVERIYTDEAAWQTDCRLIKEMLPKVNDFIGHLAEGPRVLSGFFAYREAIGGLLDKVFLYASMKKDEDNSVALYQGMKDQAYALYAEVAGALAFFEPELLSLDEALLRRYLEHPSLVLYQKHINDLLRQKAHVLSRKEEELLAQTGELAASYRNIFSAFNDADIDLPLITDEDGQKVQLSHGNYVPFLESSDRRVRQEAFEGLYGTYKKSINTLGATYAASVKKDAFYARVRNYPSALAAALDGDNIPVDVYDNLIAAVRDNLPLFQRYLALRKRIMGLDELHFYDLYCPLFPMGDRRYDYDEAKELVLDALAPLGQKYLSTLSRGLNGGWVDVYENKGKTSGAYSSGCQGQYPYILLNYQGNLNSVFTLAHEAGHSMHSWFSWQAQPAVYAEYRIFVAEVASTVNETLLLDYLLERSQSKTERLYLLNHYLEEFRGTVFRQTMFAEFEKLSHQTIEAGQPLTAEILSQMYLQLNKDYFGEQVAADGEIALEWARIPHFYSEFYVYKYATGFAAAQAIAAGLTNSAARKTYLEFLAAGDSLEPIEALQLAGVDMRQPAPIEAAMRLFARRLDEIEELIAQK